MSKIYIKDFSTQKVLGIIETLPNGDQVAIDYLTRRTLGKYIAKFD